jgi:hypothetical protein
MLCGTNSVLCVKKTVPHYLADPGVLSVKRQLDRDNTRIWNTYYRPKPLFDHLPTWQEWLPEYRQLIIEVQDMVKARTARGTWKRPA